MATGVITAGIDGSPASHTAAEWGAFAAERRGVTLRLVHAIVPPPAGGYPEPSLLRPKITDKMRNRIDRILTKVAEQVAAEHPDLRIETAQHDGPPVPFLIDESARSTATVVGADGAGRLSTAFFGSVAARLAAHGHGCIVVARPLPGDADPTKPAAVVVGVDGSPQAQAAIGFAFEEASLRGAPLLAIHTWNDTPLRHALGNYPLDINATGVDDQELRLLEVELAGWEEKYPKVPVALRILRGQPAPNLIRYASATRDQPAQLVVVGSRGRGGFAGLLLGSVSQAVIAHAGCSVAVVHQ